VRLNPLTDAIPVVNLYLTINETDKVSFGAKTSRYGPYGLGYRRATKTFNKVMQNFSYLYNKGFKIYILNIEEDKDELIIKKSYIIIYCTDCHLKFGDMKQEFRVIVDH